MRYSGRDHFVLLLLVLLTAPIHAEDASPLKAVLEAPILAPGQVLREVREFIEPRIIRPPTAGNRAEWEETVSRLRREVLDRIVFRGAAAEWRDAKCGVEWLDTIDGGPGYRIRKFRYEALPGMWLPGLLYLPEKLVEGTPVAMHVNGHAPEGKAVNYKQLRSINLAKRGIPVVDLEWFGMGQLRTNGFAHGRMNQLELCGASGLAPFYLALTRGLDIATALEHVDKSRVMVSGLSGGGWQTILISSLDERVTLANPVAGYGGFRTNILFDDMGDSEQAPTDMATIADYTHLTALRAPRPTLLTYNANDDCCFQSGHTLDPLVEAARPIFKLYGAEDRLRSHVNHVPGTHNFEQENREALYAAIGDFLYAGDATFERHEIASESELKTAEHLNVPLPADNVDFHRLAETLASKLPHDAALPTDQPAAKGWQQQKREQLKALLRVPSYPVVATSDKQSEAGKYRVTSRRFRCGESWTVPAIEVEAASPAANRTAIVLADGGRASLGDEVERLTADGYRVLAVDPLLLGESKVGAQDPEYTYALFLSAVGERALAIQAAQLVAIAQAIRSVRPNEPVTLMAVGPRASMATLVATALEHAAINGAEVSGALASLKQLLEEDKAVEELPELFAFGLLAEFDVRDLVAMAAPRSVTFRNADERTKKEIASLDSWYKLYGIEFSPIPK